MSRLALLEDARRRAEALAASGALTEARRWADRAVRLAPGDPNALFLLATLCLRLGERHGETLLAGLSEHHDVREVWIGLAAIRRRHGDLAGAAQAASRGLSGHAICPEMAAVVQGLAAAAGRPGWCGLAGDGRVTVGDCPAAPSLWLDERPVPWRGRHRRATLPPGWESARRLTIRCGDAPLLGSPIEIAAIRRTEGFVTLDGEGLSGWAWHPADPDRQPELTLRTPAGAAPIRPADTTVTVSGRVLLARPRGFTIPAALLAGAQVRVLDRDGRDLPGSPLYPGAEQRAAAALVRQQAGGSAGADLRWLPLPVLPLPKCRASGRSASQEVSIVLVAADAGAVATAAALRRVQATMGGHVPVILAPLRGRCAEQPGVVVLDPPELAGWAAAANAGLRHAAGRDAVLLDTAVAPPAGWLAPLRAACLQAEDIGTASPLGGAAASADSPPADSIEAPLAHEACLYMRAACRAQVGDLRADMFPQGEGAVADFCLRAAALGWRHMAVPAVVVAFPQSAPSAAEIALRERNQALLSRLHPGLEAMLATHPAAALLATARRGLAAARWRGARTAAGAVLLLTHADGGGVERHIRLRAAHWRAAGKRPVVLRPAPREAGPGWCVLAEPAPLSSLGEVTEAADEYADLRFHLPDELDALAALLQEDRPMVMEVHHLLGHHHAVMELAHRLQIPYEIFVHDYAWFCPRVLLVGRDRRYCGEPDLAGCQACIADLGSALEEEISVPALRARSAADLSGARRIVAPSQDAAARLRRHFPGIDVQVVPWEDDPRVAAAPPARAAVTRVCVVGAIGIEKGFELLLACARDAAARRLPLEFVVVGHTIDDARLLETGRVFVTGEYRAAEAVALIAAQAASLGFVPSLWPETWCYTLSHLWDAGLDVMAFDIGAPAERIRRSGRGRVFPFGLQAPAVNHALLASAAELSKDPLPPRTGDRVKMTAIY